LLASNSCSTAGPVFETIRSRRVTREFSDEPVSQEDIFCILEAARRAPSGGNRRLNVYVVVHQPDNLRKLRAAAPGILGHPQVAIVMCIDHQKERTFAFDDTDHGSIYVDLGTASQNMLLAAEELGLGACPIMSFHKGAIQILLDLPNWLEPAMMVILGYPAPPRETVKRPRLRLQTIEEITHWEHYEEKETR
jgi:nitroreductase